MPTLADLFKRLGADKIDREFQNKLNLINEFLILNRKEDGIKIQEVLGWIGAVGSKHLSLIDVFSEEDEDVTEICLGLIKLHEDQLKELSRKIIRRKNVQT